MEEKQKILCIRSFYEHKLNSYIFWAGEDLKWAVMNAMKQDELFADDYEALEKRESSTALLSKK